MNQQLDAEHASGFDESEVSRASLRHARALGVLAAAETAYRHLPGDAFAQATLRASQEVIEARIALSEALARCGTPPNPDHIEMDQRVAAARVGVAGG